MNLFNRLIFFIKDDERALLGPKAKESEFVAGGLTVAFVGKKRI